MQGEVSLMAWWSEKWLSTDFPKSANRAGDDTICMNKDWRRAEYNHLQSLSTHPPGAAHPSRVPHSARSGLLSQLRPTAMPISVSSDGILETRTFVLEEVGCNHQLTTVQRQPNNPLGGNDFSATSSRDNIRNWCLDRWGHFYISVLTASRKRDFYPLMQSGLHLPCSPRTLSQCSGYTMILKLVR